MIQDVILPGVMRRSSSTRKRVGRSLAYSMFFSPGVSGIRESVGKGGEKGALGTGQRRRGDEHGRGTVIFVEEGSERDEHENWCVGKSSAPLVRSLSRENQNITEL